MLNKKIIFIFLTIGLFFLCDNKSSFSQSGVPTPLGSTEVWQALKNDLNGSGKWNQISFADGSILSSVSGGISLTGILTIDSQLLLPDGSGSVPSRSWTDDNDTGWRRAGSGQERFVANGDDIWVLISASLEGAATGAPSMRNLNASATVPGFAFRDATTSGLGVTGNAPTIIANSVEGIRVTEASSETLTEIKSNGIDTSAILELSNTGGDFQIFRDDASPEGVITGSIGDLTVDSTGGEIYIKESGSSTNTGWVEVGGGVAAFSSLWYHGVEDTTSIGTSTTFFQITSFENVGLEDAGGNVIGDATTDDDITINLAGTYEIEIGSSFKNASGSNKNMIIVPGVTLATPLVITDASNATPIVITSEAHGLLNGDMVTISNVGGNTNANGDFFVSNKGDDTFELEDLANNDIAANDDYTSGGTVDIKYPGEAVIERVVSGNDLGRGMAEGTIALAVGDIVELYIANETDANNFITSQITMKVFREE